MTDKTRYQAPGVAGSSTVLLVDDLDVLRNMVRDFLESQHIRVLEAANGYEAIQTALHYPGTIDLLLTDIEMPGMSGWELANEISGLKPGIHAVFMSAGIGPQQNGLQSETQVGIHFIQKPFRLEELKGLLTGILSR